jgi:tetratricopeptide (TPR) repeat protein
MCNTDPQVLYELGLTYFADEKYKKCLKTLKEALRHNPYPTYLHDIFYHIGIAYCREEKFEKAIFPLSRCIDLMSTDIRYIHERAKAYQMIGMHE